MKSSLIQKFIIVIFAGVFLAQPFFVLAEETSNNNDVSDVIELSDEQYNQFNQELNSPLTFDNIDPKYYDYGYFAYQEEKIITEAISANDSMDEWQKMNLLSQLDNDDFYIMDTLNDKISYLQNNTNVLPGATVIASLYNFDSPVIAQNVYPKKSMNGLLQNAFAADTNYREQIMNLYKQSYCKEAGNDFPNGQGPGAQKCNLSISSQQYENSWVRPKDLTAITSQLQSSGFILNFYDQYIWWKQFFQKYPSWSRKNAISAQDLDRFYSLNTSFSAFKKNQNWNKQETEIISGWNKMINNADFDQDIYEIWQKYITAEGVSLASGDVVAGITSFLWKTIGAKVAQYIVANTLRSVEVYIAENSLYIASVYAKDLATNFYRLAGAGLSKISGNFSLLAKNLQEKIAPHLEKNNTLYLTRKNQAGFINLFRNDSNKTYEVNSRNFGQLKLDFSKILRQSKLPLASIPQSGYMVVLTNTLDELVDSQVFNGYLDKKTAQTILQKIRFQNINADEYGLLSHIKFDGFGNPSTIVLADEWFDSYRIWQINYGSKITVLKNKIDPTFAKLVIKFMSANSSKMNNNNFDGELYTALNNLLVEKFISKAAGTGALDEFTNFMPSWGTLFLGRGMGSQVYQLEKMWQATFELLTRKYQNQSKALDILNTLFFKKTAITNIDSYTSDGFYSVIKTAYEKGDIAQALKYINSLDAK